MRAAADRATIPPSSRAAGRVLVPGDKSISHRYGLLAALADGESIIRGYSRGATAGPRWRACGRWASASTRPATKLSLRSRPRGLRPPLVPSMPPTPGQRCGCCQGYSRGNRLRPRSRETRLCGAGRCAVITPSRGWERRSLGKRIPAAERFEGSVLGDSGTRLRCRARR